MLSVGCKQNDFCLCTIQYRIAHTFGDVAYSINNTEASV